MSIKIGNIDATFKVGSSAVTAIFLGSTQVYPEEQPVTDFKYKLTLSDSSVISAACDATSAITQAEISAYTSTTVSVEIGNCVITIGNRAFQNCTGLTSIVIPNSVTKISNNAFKYCTSLTSVTISDSVTNIYNSAFEGCSSLTSVTCFATTPPTIGYTTFLSAPLTNIYVPSEAVDTYKAAYGWSDYADRIQPIP